MTLGELAEQTRREGAMIKLDGKAITRDEQVRAEAMQRRGETRTVLEAVEKLRAKAR